MNKTNFEELITNSGSDMLRMASASDDTEFGQLAIESWIGGRKENQDSFGYKETSKGLLIVVCDGMGGAKGGKTASQLAAKTIIQDVEASSLNNSDEILVNAIAKANETVFKASRSNPDLTGMGTTAVVLLVSDKKATVAHVGDSRFYQIRNNKKVFRTFDHSMVFELVKRGTISEEQARLSSESNVILRAIGTKDEVDIEVDHDIPFLKNDRFLLCSDGISGAVPEKELIKMVSVSKKGVRQTTKDLAKTVDQLGLSAGGKHDNLTAALLQLNIKSKIEPKMNKKSKIIIGITLLLLLLSLGLNLLQYLSKPQSGVSGGPIRQQISNSEPAAKVKTCNDHNVSKEDK